MKALDDLVARATADPHVLGPILAGSQACGMATEHMASVAWDPQDLALLRPAGL